jgi:hypothetical protein
MKTIDELLSELDRLDVKVWADGDRLRFTAPKETPGPEILTQLRERREEILERLARTRAAASSYFPPISSVSSDAPLPLSYTQEAFWKLEELIPGNSFSNLISGVRIIGRIDMKALEQAFDEIIRRHEILRTMFANVEGQPAQIVSEPYHCVLSVEDISEFPEAEQNVEFFRRTLHEYHKPFDFKQGPMFRVVLLRMSDEEHILLQMIHHIICDGWSMQVLNRELAVLYEAFSEGRSSRLPELSIQYADYAAWQRQVLAEGILETQLSYWKQQLSGGDLPPLSLPTDYPRPTEQSFRTSRQIIMLPTSLSEALKSMGDSEGCTPMMTLLSAFKILLYGLTGQADIRLGTVVAIRNQSQTEGLVGLFINTLVLRTDLSGDPTIRVVMRRVRATVLEAYEHQHLPFEYLVQAFEREGGFKRNSLFQIMFIYHPALPPPVESSGLTLHAMDFKEMENFKRTPTTFDLIFTLREKPEGVIVSLAYKTSLFSEPTIDATLGHFQEIVQRVISDPECRLSGLPPIRL